VPDLCPPLPGAEALVAPAASDGHVPTWDVGPGTWDSYSTSALIAFPLSVIRTAPTSCAA
jgi:hypothetical protein